MTAAKVIDDLASKILDSTKSKLTKEDQDNFGFDPITILMMISIILTLVRVIQECRKDKSKLMKQSEKTEYLCTEIKSLSFNNTLFNRLRIRSVIKKHLNKSQNKRYGESLLQALLEAGKTITDEQVSALLEYKNV